MNTNSWDEMGNDIVLRDEQLKQLSDIRKIATELGEDRLPDTCSLNPRKNTHAISEVVSSRSSRFLGIPWQHHSRSTREGLFPKPVLRVRSH
jgi:hypothetical protein